MEVIYVLDQPHSKKSYNAVSHNFNVNESTVWYIQKKVEETCHCEKKLLQKVLKEHL